MQRKFASISLTVLAAAALSACGGGGGSPGETQFPYTITLNTNKTELPVNLARVGPLALGIYGTYTATLAVQVRIGDRAAPVGTPVQCNITRGLGDTAALYYLDGERDPELRDEEGEVIPGSAGPSREVALTTGAEGFATFHVHSSDRAGEVQVNCSATDPRDQRVLSAFQVITVGSTRQNVPARVQYEDQAARLPHNILGTNGNVFNLSNSVEVQAYLTDDRGQPVASQGGTSNIKVTILNNGPGEPGFRARLLYGNQPAASEVDVRTDFQGLAQFSLAAGNVSGPIIVRMLADRCDNDVTNGVTTDLCAIAAITSIYAHAEIPEGPLRFIPEETEFEVDSVSQGMNVWFALNVHGGVPPYRWTMESALHPGLQLSPQGVVFGRLRNVNPIPEQYFTVRVTDATGSWITQLIQLKINPLPSGGGGGGGAPSP